MPVELAAGMARLGEHTLSNDDRAQERLAERPDLIREVIPADVVRRAGLEHLDVRDTIPRYRDRTAAGVRDHVRAKDWVGGPELELHDVVKSAV
jgi:hypothetical protein